jgi:vitamin B12 transporter
MKKRLVFAVIVTLFSLTGWVQAQVKPKQDGSVATLEAVVVTASRVEEKKKEITSNVTIIDPEKIENSSAKDLGDLLAEEGIGHIQKYPGTLTSIGIRGFRTEAHGNDLMGHVLILLNGRRAGTGNAAKIMTKNIERVEIIRGPASVQYGSAAMGGVVNVITKQGRDKPSAFVEGMLGSFDHKEGSVGFSGKFKGFDFSGSFTTDSMGDYDTGNGEKFHNTGYNGRQNASLNIGYAFLPENRIGIIYNYFNADKVGTPNYISQNDLDDYKDTSKKSVDFIYEGSANNGLFSWKARYFDGNDENKWTDPTASNPDFWDDAIPNKVAVDHKGAQAQVSYDQEYLLATAGLDWVNYITEDDTYSPKKTEYNNPAFFVLAKARLSDQRFIVSAGVRYDDYTVDMKDEGGKETDDHISPRLGAAYLLTDYLKLRANYGNAFKMPSARQLAGNYPGWSGNYVGNPDLKPETSNTYEGGLDFSYASFNTCLTYFYTDFKDKIQTTSTPTGDTTWENLGKAEISGFEGEFSYDIGAYFTWDFELRPYVSFVYLTRYKDKETGEDLKYTSDANVSFGITFSGFNGLSSNLSVAYTGKQNVDDWESGAWPAPVIQKGSFSVANFTIAKKILDFNKYGSMTLRGEIQNLFDKNYEYVKGFPMPGRSFFLGLRYSF